MYSILLVDDESQVRKTMHSRIPWEDYGFSVIAEAENGLEALDIIAEKSPDVVITDIRMPYLDGIKLIKEIRKEKPTTTIVILSGYDEFTYAQSAIKLNVAEYVLKPVDKEDIIELLKKIKKRLDNEIESVNNKQKLENLYKEVIPELKQQTVNQIYSGKYKENLSKAIEYKLPHDKDYYMTAVIDTSSDNDNLILLSINQILDNFFSLEDSTIKSIFKNQIVLTFSRECKKDDKIERPLFIKRVLKKIEDIHQYIIFYTKQQFDIGVSEIVNHFSSLPVSYRQCINALNYKPYYPDQKIFFIKDLENEKLIKASQASSDELIENLITTIKLGSKEEIDIAVLSLFDSKSGLNPLELQSLMFKIVSLLANLALSYEIDLSSSSSIFSEITTLNTINKTKPWLQKISKQINEEIIKKRKSSNIKFVEEAKKLIEQNYSDKNFCLDSICDMLAVSNSYFSTTFKKETKTAFTKALNTVRIEHSKPLLLNSEFKTYQVAELVGFSDSNYFSFCFKKIEGISPSSYKNKNKRDS